MFQLPRGTRDFTPEEMAKRRYVEKVMRTTFLTFGYKEIQTPTFEHVELFTEKSGQGIIDELYTFADKGGRNLTLRPELTAPVIRFYVNQLQMEPKPLKLFYFGNCFRYDRPQKGRYREFWQAGCELIGTKTPEGQAELIALAYTLLKDVGVEKMQGALGNLTVVRALFNHFNLTQEQQQEILPLIDKQAFDELQSTLENMGLQEEKTSKLLTLLQTTDISLLEQALQKDKEALEQLTTTKKILELLSSSFGITSFTLNMSIVRGLDYYKDMVFEIEAPALGAEKQLCGGGMYDLVKLFGGTSLPTAGFAIGFDRTVLTLETEKYHFPTCPTHVYVIPIEEEMIPPALQLTQQLRQEGFFTDVDLVRRGVGKALKYANTQHIPICILLGPDEQKNNTVCLRDMNTGKQTTIPQQHIIKELKQHLKHQ